MVLPNPTQIDERMSEAQAGITLDMVVEFIQNAPPEFIDYLLEMLSQQEAQSQPAPDPALNAAMGSVTPAIPPMR